MLRSHVVQNRALFLGVALLLSISTVCLAQESRGSITGKVVDPQNSVVPGAAVVVTNTATNVSDHATTNQTGYFEVVSLNPGPYSVSVESSGFKKLVRTGISLSTGDRLALDLQLEIGQTSQSVEVTADAPLLDTTNAATGRVLNTRDIGQLPYTTMNPFALQAMAAGMIFTGAMTPDNNRALDHAATASYDSGGLGTGTNEFLLDGNPVTGTNGGRAGFVPNAEAVDEVRIETSPYDASMGHSVGSFISATVKSGTNALHGAGFWQFQQFRWNAAPHFTRLNYQAGLANGSIAAGTPEQASGRVTTPGFGVGGPVWIPKVINGKNKLFFYISYSKLVSIAPPNSTPIYTVPTVAQRTGDFSALLVGTTNPSQYIVYDPRTAATVSGHVTRTPFPNNIVPASMQTSPIAKFFSQLYPLPNNPSQLQADGTNNFYDGGQPNNDWFPNFINRYDYNINDRQHLNGKWYFNSRLSDQYDWAHNTPLKGVESNGLYRPTRGGSLDYLFTISANNVLDVTFSITQYSEGDKKPIVLQYTAASVGLPSYIDQKAGSSDCLPWINIAGVANAASTSFVGAQGLNQRGTTEQLAIRMTTIKGKHTFKYGWEDRRYHYASVNPLGNTTGYYQFSNTYDRQADNTTTASTTGLGYAAFLMGLPNSMAVDTNDTGYWTTPHHSVYFQDDFRVTSKLRIGFGLRFEREGGITERFNRGLEGQYDFSYVPPYASAVQSAYASLLSSPANASNAAIQMLQQGMPASSFKVAGGVTYLGQQYSNWTSGTNRFLPNVSLVYQINSKTVLRTGTGWSSDTYNSMNSRPGMNGYSQSTSTILTNDNGLTYCCDVGAASNMGKANPLMNPFPVLTSGSRWVMPFGNSLGAGILDGQGSTNTSRDYAPTKEQRYSLGIQRELHGNHRVEVSYNGGYASLPMTRNLSYLPAQYWNFSNSYNVTVENAMKATVANPFLAALPAIQVSNPTLYNYLSNVAMFTGTTLQVQQLLRAYPNAGFGLNQANYFRNKIVDNEMRVMYQKRWSHGFQSMVQYAHMWGRQQWLANQFDPEPEWQLNSNIRPNRLVWSNVVELPFGKGHQWLREGPLSYVAGGWQVSWVYTYQTGPLISWSNLFYYGSVDQVAAALNDDIHSKNLHMWYDPAAVWTSSAAPPSTFVGFEGRSAVQPGTYQARVFPQYIDSLRADGIRNWDAKILRRFAIHENVAFVVSVDLLNLTNHTQFTAPNLTVTSSAFGSLSGQSNAGRILQFATRLQF
ncbi:MAG: carboxypeptidase-like regulatory domain-containing protein [Bryobacteraceae bacterium]|jgi:hypothetical protein